MKKAFVFACLPFLALFSCARINHYKLAYIHDDFSDIVNPPTTVPDNKDLLLQLSFTEGYGFKPEVEDDGSIIRVAGIQLKKGITYLYDENSKQLFISYKFIIGDIDLDIKSGEVD